MTNMNKARTALASLLVAAVAIPTIALAQGKPPADQGQLGTAVNLGGLAVGNTSIRVCCPPVATQSFAPYFAAHQLPGKNATQTYGLNFTASAVLDAQMAAYAPFAALFAPATWTGHSVMLHAEMKELTSLPIGASPTAADFALGTNTPVNTGKLRGWYVSGGVWNGPDGPPTPYVWNTRFNDGQAVSPVHMKPNKLYMIKLTLRLGSNKPGQPSAWREDTIDCMTKYFVYGVNVPPMLAAQGSNANVISTVRSFEVR